MSNVDHPDHYNQVPEIECIDVVEHFNFNRGNAIKYIWRAGHKADATEDLEKALFYIQRELDRMSRPADTLNIAPVDTPHAHVLKGF